MRTRKSCEYFAVRNEMDVVSAEVSGSVGLGYFKKDDMLNCLSLLELYGLACILYTIDLSIIPTLPQTSPPSQTVLFSAVFYC